MLGGRLFSPHQVELLEALALALDMYHPKRPATATVLDIMKQRIKEEWDS
jgi:hypothetical protein